MICAVNYMHHFRDDKINGKSGLYFENRGPLKIIATKWDLMAYLNMTAYNQQTESLFEYVNITDALCKSLGKLNLTDVTCTVLHSLTNRLSRQMNDKRTIILESIGYSSRS